MKHTGYNTAQSDNWMWENYWHGDRVALCLDTDYFEYDESVTSQWKSWFSKFPQDSKLLDVCTGNGAIAILAKQSSLEEEKIIHVTGVDKAQIDPARFVKSNSKILNEISFSGGIDISALPYKNATFDAVAGQYALEYTDKAPSLAEISRVLKHQARVRFLIHASEGVVAEGARRELARIDNFRKTNNVITTAQKAMETSLKLKKITRPAKSLMDKANKAKVNFQASLRATPSGHTENDTDFIHGTLSRLVNLIQAIEYHEENEIKKQFKKIQLGLDAHQGRLQSLINAALSKTECEQLAEILQIEGFKTKPVYPETKGENQIGWVLEATRE